MKKTAFTLIELLVVIAIISILAAVLFPVFATAREKARQTTCSSNLKQIGLAYIQYAQDFDEQLPSSSFYGYGWAGHIYPYVKSIGVFQCPDDSHTTTLSPSLSSYSTKTTAVPISYAINQKIACYPVVQQIEPGFPISQATAPASTVLLFEASQNGRGFPNESLPTDPSEDTDFGLQASQIGYGIGAGFKGVGNWTTGATSTISGCSLPTELPATAAVLDAKRHDPVSFLNVYLLLDGHVKALVITKVSDPCNNNVVTTSNLGNGNGFTVTLHYL